MQHRTEPHRTGRSQTHVSLQTGFSLIELMLVVAIIATLTMIAVPQYQRYSAKARIAGAIQEVSGGKIGMEALFAEGSRVWGIKDPSTYGIPKEPRYCLRYGISTVFDEVRMMCDLPPGNYGLGHSTFTRVHLRRDRAGRWFCESDVFDKSLLPADCRDPIT